MTTRSVAVFAAALAATLALSACGSGDAPAAGDSPQAAAIDFGDDNGQWANDNECDDKRFIGEGMTATPLLDADIGHDATDCRTAYEAGRLQLREGVSAAAPAAAAAAPVAAAGGAAPDFGDNSSRWANDNECDDKRFTGEGMTATPLLDEDIGHDANDCRAAFEAGRLQLR